MSPPYTGELARDKVMQLAKQLSAYSGGMRVYLAPFTKCQLEIHDKCPEGLGTLITRRFMMRIAEKIARKDGASALITGESIGQVASQTMEALVCTDAVVNMPVFRPADWSGQDGNHGNREQRSAHMRLRFCLTRTAARYSRRAIPSRSRSSNTMPDAERKLDVDALVDEVVENTEMIIL